ncbi:MULTISPECIES: GNAT family N-acetyltransferase [unclassified Halomonas]|uniref:GNAT family N-acetyltransferase n=1 Tax=unclassified Halomonas TaxID=2609666 RepID=UPI0020A054DA|nr:MULTISPECIES: GNAT family N-acetyltransferase [unclassified Halomonas]MCP1315154.1 GNAT family N-acetyltransferase [Halomonas sp. 707D7]MCP1328214.1 GNAT family N-acetyltransferase [Halomonas sp. 707D4]
MNDIEFRAARRDDVAGIVALLADDVLGRQREDATSPLNERYTAAFDAIDADPHQLQLVALADGEVVGTLQLTFIPGLARLGAWRGQIEGVRIASTHRSAGLGQAMFQRAIDECRQRGCELVQLTTDIERPDAQRFYERLGFRNTHLGYKLTL